MLSRAVRHERGATSSSQFAAALQWDRIEVWGGQNWGTAASRSVQVRRQGFVHGSPDTSLCRGLRRT
jgi:hypothetical protein